MQLPKAYQPCIPDATLDTSTAAGALEPQQWLQHRQLVTLGLVLLSS